MHSHRSVRSLIAVAMLASLVSLTACNPPEKGNSRVTDEDVAEGAVSTEGPSIDKSVGELFAGAKPDSVKETPIKGLFEVVVNGNIYYTDKDGIHMISGEMLRVEGKKNLTAEARDGIRKGMMGELNKDEAIVYKAKGKVKEVLHVFTDVECGYCREFHKRIDAYNRQGYEVHYYPWPRSGTSGPVYDEMVSVWCAKDQRAALTAAKSGNKPAAKTCNNPVAKYFELGRKMGIQGTPAVFLDNGKQVGGYVPPENIEAAIDTANGKMPAPTSP